jgi:hypothetical protein
VPTGWLPGGLRVASGWLVRLFKVRGSRFEVQGSRFKVRGSRFEVQGSRFKVRGSRFEVEGSGVRGSALDVGCWMFFGIHHSSFNLLPSPAPFPLSGFQCFSVSLGPGACASAKGLRSPPAHGKRMGCHERTLTRIHYIAAGRTKLVCLQGIGRAVRYNELQNIQAAVNDDKIHF